MKLTRIGIGKTNCLKRLAVCLMVLGPSSVVWAIQTAEPASRSTNNPVTRKTADPTYFMSVRILKTADAGELSWQVTLPRSCVQCRLCDNKFTRGQNTKEFFFHFLAPNAASVIRGLQVNVNSDKVRKVLVGRAQVTFQRMDNGIQFDLPRNGPKLTDLTTFLALPADAPGNATEMYTYLDTPGVQTRIEHADPLRRNGPYANVPWPAIERQAALNLEFATREAIAMLQLGRRIRSLGIGTILLMGFDTNFPTQTPQDAHEDSPPHWHMHMSWNHTPIIRDVGHFYIGSDGLLVRNDVIGALTGRSQAFGRGETYVTALKEVGQLYTQTVTSEGYFVLGTRDGSCRLTPIGRGFDSGVDLGCKPTELHRRIRVEDNLEQGSLRLYRDDRQVEEHRYDPDNGELLRSDITYVESMD